MDEDNKPKTDEQETDVAPQAPADALSRTPDELEEEAASEPEKKPSPEQPDEKKPSALKRFFKKANLYFLLFLLVVMIGAIITVVTYLNAHEEPIEPNIATQDLTAEQLQQLANTDTSVGDTNQTLTIKGNAIIEGQTLMRGDLNIAGDLQTGGSITGPSITISGSSNLGEAQINNLQVASNVAIEGDTSMQNLSVAGTSSFNGPMTASQLTVSRLIMSGNATLEIPNHIGFTGPTPSRSLNSAQLGSGGSASVSGSDTAGTVNITTGNNPQAGCMVRINFRQNYNGRPHVLISPSSAAAGRTNYYVDRDQSGFSICATTPAPGNQSLVFDYFVAS